MTQALEQSALWSEVDDHFFTRQLSHLQTTSVHNRNGDEVPELLLSKHAKILLHVLGNFVQIAVFVPWAEMFSLPCYQRTPAVFLGLINTCGKRNGSDRSSLCDDALL